MAHLATKAASSGETPNCGSRTGRYSLGYCYVGAELRQPDKGWERPVGKAGGRQRADLPYQSAIVNLTVCAPGNIPRRDYLPISKRCGRYKCKALYAPAWPKFPCMDAEHSPMADMLEHT